MRLAGQEILGALFDTPGFFLHSMVLLVHGDVVLGTVAPRLTLTSVVLSVREKLAPMVPTITFKGGHIMRGM